MNLLLDAGADINAQDQNGRTALDDVEGYTDSSEEQRTMAAFLKERGGVNGKVNKCANREAWPRAARRNRRFNFRAWPSNLGARIII